MNKNMSSSDESSGDSGNDVPVGRKGRGSTHMGALIARRENQKKRLHVEFDANMNPIGPEDRKSTRLNSSHSGESRMPSSA